MEDDEAGSVAEAIAKKRREERQKANATVEPGSSPPCPSSLSLAFESLVVTRGQVLMERLLGLCVRVLRY
jgi:hypothetical protein